jgi:hypothetical protein
MPANGRHGVNPGSVTKLTHRVSAQPYGKALPGGRLPKPRVGDRVFNRQLLGRPKEGAPFTLKKACCGVICPRWFAGYPLLVEAVSMSGAQTVAIRSSALRCRRSSLQG